MCALVGDTIVLVDLQDERRLISDMDRSIACPGVPEGQSRQVLTGDLIRWETLEAERPLGNARRFEPRQMAIQILHALVVGSVPKARKGKAGFRKRIVWEKLG